MVKIPALNEITAQTGSHEPKYPDEPEDLRYMILYPEDYEEHGVDVEGNVALLLNEANFAGQTPTVAPYFHPCRNGLVAVSTTFGYAQSDSNDTPQNSRWWCCRVRYPVLLPR